MTSDDDLADRIDALEATVARLEARFDKLAEDFTNLRYEVNENEEKIERRT